MNFRLVLRDHFAQRRLPLGLARVADGRLDAYAERHLYAWDALAGLLLVEEALAICIWYPDSPVHGYKLAADYCQNYDPRYGTSLNGPSRTKLLEMVRFIFAVEAHELENSD